MGLGIVRHLVPLATFAYGTWLGASAPVVTPSRSQAPADWVTACSAEARTTFAHVATTTKRQAAHGWRWLRTQTGGWSLVTPKAAGTARQAKRDPGPRLPLPPDDPAPVLVDAEALPDPQAWPRLNPEASTRRAWLIAEGPARSVRDPRRLVTFTFDDGPFPETTPQVLALLAEHRVRATFFMVGRYMEGADSWSERMRKTAREVRDAGHIIGNHTLHHQILTTLPRKKVLHEVDENARVLTEVLGQAPVFFRPPFGQLTEWAERKIAERNLELVLWSIDVGDMERTDVDAMTRDLKQQLERAGGGIVLLHDVRPSSVEVLRRILPWLKEHAYRDDDPNQTGFVVTDLPGYLRATAASPQPFASRRGVEEARQAEVRQLRSERPKG
jgi:peptidoglycan/xylan/chitin deacetylase (PgdA/CDA1 family)